MKVRKEKFVRLGLKLVDKDKVCVCYFDFERCFWIKELYMIVVL